MDYLDSVFGSVEKAKALGGFTARLGIGSHTVLLKRFNVKESAKGKGKIVEADFAIVESNTHGAGETKGWAWFIGAPGWAGTYEESRLKNFLENVATCIGDTSPISAIGAGLAGPAQLGRGLMLKCVVSAQTNRDGSPKTSAKGETYTQIEWIPVSQGLEDIQKARAVLDSAPAPVQAAPAAAPAIQQAVTQQVQQVTPPAAQNPPATTGGGMSSLLASLKKTP